MHYIGGKARIAKSIASFLKSIRKENQIYFEPFVGGGWVLQEMDGVRIASDKNAALISMYKALQNGWIPPDIVMKKTYQEIKIKNNDQNPMTAFCGFGCSYSGKWFGGYAKSKNRNYAKNAKNSLLKKMLKIKNVVFYHNDFLEYSPTNKLIYCDPPYYGTTNAYGCGKFDHELFWETMRKWSKNNIVVISEYNAPKDFECVKKIETKLDIHSTNVDNKRIECLFMFKSNCV